MNKESGIRMSGVELFAKINKRDERPHWGFED